MFKPIAQSPQRVGSLDSVRGIAALMVVVGHCGGLSLPNLSDYSWSKFFGVFWDGESAVIMFFLLSGYVLALQLDSIRRPTFSQYLIRRFMRIWPAFAVMVMSAWGFFVYTGMPVDAGPHHGEPSVPGVNELVMNLLMYGKPYSINPPVWSLYVEARLSLVFPLLFLLSRRVKPIKSIAIALVLSVGLSRAVHWPLPALLLSFAEASRFLVLFVIGAVLAQPENTVEAKYKLLSMPLKVSALILALFCLGYRFVSTASGQAAPLAGYVPWLGVGLLFIFCLYSRRAKSLLERRWLLFFGRVSYGVYLAHFPIMLWAQREVPGSLVALVVVSMSLLAGWCLNLWVEQPMIEFGKRLTQRTQTPGMVAQ